ncbi:MAG: hypothetical protein KDK23_12415 [Leptospiraceae bacterium]|nr:hypothetical protein [Leptospiraceae bacterium]
MLSGKLARSSIILILLGASLEARNPSTYIFGNAERKGPYKQGAEASGGLGLLWFFHKQSDDRLHLMAENRPRPLSLGLQYGPVKMQGGTRFRPGPFTGFFVKPGGISYLPNLPDRSYRPLAFLLFDANLKSWKGSASGLSSFSPPASEHSGQSLRFQKKATDQSDQSAKAASAGQRSNDKNENELFLGSGCLLHLQAAGLALEWSRKLALFYLPQQGMGYLSWNLRKENGGPSVETAGSVYSDDRGTAGFGNFKLRFQRWPSLFRLEATRYASRDIDPVTKRPFPGRKGKSGMGNVAFFLPWLEVSAAGEDREQSQYRIVRFRLASPPWHGLRLLLHGSRTRRRIYGSSDGYRFRKNAGLGILLGSLLPGAHRRSLEHHFRAMLLIRPYRSPRGTALAGQMNVSYTRGPYWLEAGYLLARRDSFSVFDGNSRMDPSLTIYPDAEQIVRIRAGTGNVFFSLLYLETLSREVDRHSHRPSRFFSFRLQGRWKLKP